MRRGLWLWVVIGCALLLNGTFLVQRATLETHNDRVELVIDGAGLFSVAERTGVPVAELLARWQRSGVGAVAVGEPPSPQSTSAEREPAQDEFPLPSTVSLTTSQQLHALPRGVRIVPRSLAAARAAVAFDFDVGPFVPAGDAVEGYPQEIGSVASALAATELSVGVVEFAATAGLRDVVRLLDYDAVFVHSIPRKELVKLTDGQAVARFHRAVLERQARVLYIHPLWDEDATADELLTRNAAYLEAISARVHTAGLQLGPATSLPRWSTSMWAPLAAALAAVAALLLLARHVGPLPIAVELGLLVGGGVIVALLFAAGRDVLARQIGALAVAVAFPVLAIGAAFSVAESGAADRAAPAGAGRQGRPKVLLFKAGRVLLGVFIVLGVTAAGTALVAGALGDTRFLLKLEQFRGVKLAHVVPFALLAALWLFGGGQKPDVSRWRVAFNWKYALLGAVVLALGFVFVARTGHDVLPVSRLERGLREWLETALPVRPRTKEFIFGYPALLAGLLLASGHNRNRRWAAPSVIVGTIVPVSVINSFAHAHVPLFVSFVRGSYGLLLGVGVALVLGGGIVALRSVGLLPARTGRHGSGAGSTETAVGATGPSEADEQR